MEGEAASEGSHPNPSARLETCWREGVVSQDKMVARGNACHHMSCDPLCDPGFPGLQMGLLCTFQPLSALELSHPFLPSSQCHQSVVLAKDTVLGLQTPPLRRSFSMQSGRPVRATSFPAALVGDGRAKDGATRLRFPGATIPIQPALFPCGPPAQRSAHPRNALNSSVITGSPSCPTPKLHQIFAGRQESAVKVGKPGPA